MILIRRRRRSWDGWRASCCPTSCDPTRQAQSLILRRLSRACPAACLTVIADHLGALVLVLWQWEEMVKVHGMASAVPWLSDLGRRFSSIFRGSLDLGSSLRASLSLSRQRTSSDASDGSNGSNGSNGSRSGLTGSLKFHLSQSFSGSSNRPMPSGNGGDDMVPRTPRLQSSMSLSRLFSGKTTPTSRDRGSIIRQPQEACDRSSTSSTGAYSPPATDRLNRSGRDSAASDYPRPFVDTTPTASPPVSPTSSGRPSITSSPPSSPRVKKSSVVPHDGLSG